MPAQGTLLCPFSPQEEDPVPERSQEHLPAHHSLRDEGGHGSPASGEGPDGAQGLWLHVVWWHLCPCWAHPNPCDSRLLWTPMFAAAGCAAFIPSFLLHPFFLLLLQEVTSQPVMGFDPLPPLDSIVSYTRPERYHLHRWCPCWHNRPCSRRVPGTPSAPGQAAHGRSALTSSSMAEEEPWCSWQAELQAGLVRLFPVVVTTGHSQP